MGGLFKSDSHPVEGAGRMVIELLEDVVVDDSDIGGTLDGMWFWHDGDKVDMTIRSGGSVRRTFTYAGTAGIKTWGETTYAFSNVVLTATAMPANGTLFDDSATGGRGTTLQDGAEFAGSTCRAVRLGADKRYATARPFTLCPGSAIRDNVSNGYGGGVLIDGGAELVLAGGEITGNKAILGGGVYLSSAGKVVYAGGSSRVSGNTSSGDATGAGVYAASSCLPCFRVDAVAAAKVFDYFSPAPVSDGLVYGSYTVEDADLLAHFPCLNTMPPGAALVAEERRIFVRGAAAALIRLSTDGGLTWTNMDDLRGAMEAATSDGQAIIELQGDVTYASQANFQNRRFTLRSRSEAARHTVTLTDGGFFWLNKTDVVLSNVLVTAESGFSNGHALAFVFQGDAASLTLQGGAEIADIPVAAVGEMANGSSGGRLVLEAGARIVRCGSTEQNGGGFSSVSGNVGIALRGGEISSCRGRLGGVYLPDGATMEIFADSVVTGNLNAASAAANVYQSRPGAVVIASAAVTGANKVFLATPEGNDGELVAGLAEGLEEGYEVPAAVLKSDDNATAKAVRAAGGIAWSTERPHKAFRYANDDGVLFFEADTFKEAYDSPIVGQKALVVELMKDATIGEAEGAFVQDGRFYVNRKILLRSHGATRRTLTRSGGSNLLYLFGGAEGSVVSNVVLTADSDTYSGAFVLGSGGGTHYLGDGCEIRPPEGLQGLCLGGSSSSFARLVMLPGSKITGCRKDVPGVAVECRAAGAILDVRGGEISGNVGKSAILPFHDGGKSPVFVSGGARIADNHDFAGKCANLRFETAQGLLVQTGDLTEDAEVYVRLNDVKDGVFGVSSNETAGCYQAWKGAERIRSDARKSLFGSSLAADEVVRLVWTKLSKGALLVVR